MARERTAQRLSPSPGSPNSAEHIRAHARLYARYFVPRRGACTVAELARRTARAEDGYLLPVLLGGEVSAPVARPFIRRTSTLNANERHGLIFGPFA
jgi:hypothetical protein